MDDSKINIYLSNKGIDSSIPFLNLEKELMEEIKQKEIFRSSYFELVNIHYSLKGQKKELVMKNCKLENMNMTQVQVTGKCIFYNCIFSNVKMSKCTFSSSCFYHCSFDQTVVMDCSLKSSFFINCDGLEYTDFTNNNLDNVKIIGNILDHNFLEEHNNKIEDLYMREEKYRTDMSENQQIIPTGRNIVEKKIFENEIIHSDQLSHILYNECQFIDCELESSVMLDSTVDFCKCLFKNTKIENPMIEKVTFDKSTFVDVLMDSIFLHCSFIKCHFDNVKFSEDAAFKSCNFAYSNAKDVFDIEKQHMENVTFNDGNQQDDQLNGILASLYDLLKKRDLDLQEQLNQINSNDVNKDILVNYMLGLNDREYINFITAVGERRKDDGYGKS